jgi:hypothetical protein
LVLPLAGCQALAEGLPAVFNRPAAITDTPSPTDTPRILTPLPATYTPVVEQPQPTRTPEQGLPEILVDFPLLDGSQVIAEETQGDASSAVMNIRTSKSPGELNVFYKKALQEKGWTLRYAEGNAVGGFLQEWKKEQLRLTVEYHFSAGKPVVSVDARAVDSNQALSLLLGFPLPNGTEVLRTEGSAIELYVPQDLKTTVDFFRKQVLAEKWRFEEMKSTGWCGSRGCQEVLEESFRVLATLEPTPTADNAQKLAVYQVTMPDRTQAEITFLPQRAHTRVYIKVHFLDFTRSGIQVSLYPGATITGILTGVAMFETTDNMKAVVAYYEDKMAGMGWEAHNFTVNQPDMYTRSWTKKPNRVVTLSLSTVKGKGIVRGTLNCSTCKDPYFVIPSSTPSPAPSR